MVQDTSLPTGVVTFLFTDIEGSTRLLRDLGDQYGDVLERHRELLRAGWGNHGGHEVNTEGDAFLVAFRSADDAVRACAAGQRALATEPWPDAGVVRVRMGLHLGLASPRSGDYIALAVHQAARVVSTGHGGQVVLTAEVANEIGPPGDLTLKALGRFRLRDFDEPVELFQLMGPGLEPSFPAVRALPADRHNLVRQPTLFVDRHTETGRVGELTAPGCLVSVVGPGGVGKTRLATEIGTTLASAWDDGVWLVELAPLARGGEIAGAVSSALGVPAPAGTDPWRHVLDHLRGISCLLILDNCEHLVERVATVVSDVLVSCPGVGLLATSREPLGVKGEIVYRIDPLAVAGAAKDATAIGAAPATELFVDRARAVLPDFSLDEATAADCALICQHLDGLPLAIELAAARVAVMTPAEILRGLDDRFRLLRGRDRAAPDRHRTMEALLDWSYRLLSPAEQAVLRATAVFAAGFGTEMAEAASGAVPPGGDDAGEVLWSLVEKSLVVTDIGVAGTSYRLPESVRAYARHLLDERGETEGVALAAARWLLHRVAPWLPIDRVWIGEMAAQLDNLRALIGPIASTDQELAQQIACSVGRYHDAVHSFREGIVTLDRNVTALPAPTATRVVLLADLGFLHLRVGEISAAAEALEAAETSLRQAGRLPAWDDVAVERLRGELHNRRGDYQAGADTARRELERGPSVRGVGRMSNLLGLALLGLGDLDHAYRAFEGELEAYEREDLESYIASSHGNLAEVAMQQGRTAVAAGHQKVCLELGVAVGAPVMVAFSLIVAARLAAGERAWGLAVRLHTRAEAILGETGVAIYTDDAAISEAMLAEAARRLGRDAMRAEQAAGEGLELPEAIDHAREVFDRLAQD
jgi:predicted ATPase/class 3 adenylate cyclase